VLPYFPAAHWLHAVAPGKSEYFPAAHGAQADEDPASFSGEAVPAGQ
jgi:hypothetical protein